MMDTLGDVIILAGGLGTRLRSKVPDRPKSMAPVNGRPFLEYQLSYLKASGFTRVILSVGYLSEMIRDHFGTCWQDLEVLYSIEDEPLGTGGAIKKAMSLVQSDQFFVLNGDTMFLVDFRGMRSKAESLHADAVIALREVDDAGRYGLVVTDGTGRILDFREKDTLTKSGLINGGVYLLKKELIDISSLPEKFSAERDLFPVSCKTKHYLGLTFDAYFLDIGIPQDLERAETEFPKLAVTYDFFS